MPMNLRTASIAATVLLVAVIVALYIRHELLGTNTVAVILQVAAVALMLWARVTFGRRSFHAAANPTAGGLVTWGPYRHWRHPIYSAVLLFLWSGVLSHGLDPLAITLAVVGTLATIVRVLSEERLLRAEFSGSDGYDAYARRTKRFVPFVF
jgi:protein-S-isoprenylcysteine O-methyltransferase Ste14